MNAKQDPIQVIGPEHPATCARCGEPIYYSGELDPRGDDRPFPFHVDNAMDEDHDAEWSE